MELDRETKAGLNIASEAELLSYTAARQASVAARVRLGSGGQLIAGGGEYALRLYVAGVRVLPDSVFSVPDGVTQTVLSSRPFLVDAGEIVSVRALGLPADTAVTTVTILQDVTPAAAAEGGGSVAVDHDYGGADVLAYKTSGGVGVDNAAVDVFLTSDWDADRRSGEYRVARSSTVVQGRWARPVMLDPGEYTVVFYKQGLFGPDTREVTVTE